MCVCFIVVSCAVCFALFVLSWSYLPLSPAVVVAIVADAFSTRELRVIERDLDSSYDGGLY